MNPSIPLPSQQELQYLFEYVEGDLYWRNPKCSRIKPGQRAGFSTGNGRRQVKVNNKAYLLHRLIYKYHHGVDPTNLIDHIDRDPSNNKIENLRDVTYNMNNMNTDRCNFNPHYIIQPDGSRKYTQRGLDYISTARRRRRSHKKS